MWFEVEGETVAGTDDKTRVEMEEEALHAPSIFLAPLRQCLVEAVRSGAPCCQSLVEVRYHEGPCCQGMWTALRPLLEDGEGLKASR